ncbi:50S ribosomal protein L24 [Candidatus Wolfebacteria bacterium CG02_land_8_20_14_3_00_37_12]|uniref:Large ribosomal subunit protein uL24 n=3 Tax=Candidatus Wolfeibacteriota TaxID=1752735 RepID=A0A2M7Q7C7_9BACT|nr:MAG: 50S ribosomal protein L24 [Candidatus Wolfebacteria bacterium CG02_land_8_20_14_3_00_37_12]PIY59341.1 MAG: 50S ribosomal protein L24 [Candidatus Wolfebacteria bacterium CG_4_10_14_0_8_um_filter_37_11]PJA41873.1 MAG: 50S ribosomal protein L24 [Candidatus Wolfebacteria bacterium CG_4_9_14_3_um_filter_37_9]
MKIHKNDTIKILVGKDKNKTGKVLKVFPAKNKILVENLNIFKKHVRPKKQGEKGQIISIPRPIDVSNAAILCSSCGKTTRIGYKIEKGNKMRICKKCSANI